MSAANGPSGATTNLISFDAEALHLFNDGSGYTSDEYGTYIARFNSSKQITNIIQLPASARPTNALPGASANFGTTNPGVFKAVSLVDISAATNILGTYDATGNQISPGGTLVGGIIPAARTEVINLLSTTDLTKFGYNTNNSAKNINTLSEKWEGMSLVPDLSTADPYDYFLFVANDNDFQAATVTMLDASGNLVSNPLGDPRDGGITNDAQFLAYSVRMIPEPSSAMLALLAGFGFVLRRSR